MLGHLGEGLRKQGLAQDWMLSGRRGSVMIGYSNKSNLFIWEGNEVMLKL